MSETLKPTPEQKLRGILEYCLLHGSTIGKVPKTKLFKLIYLADFSAYYLRGNAISELTYKNRPHGPVPDELFALVDELVESGDIDVEEGRLAFLHKLTVEPTHIKFLDKEEKALLEVLCKYWKAKPTKTIVNFTHAQRPWCLTNDGEEVPYELILQEDHPYLPTQQQ